MENVVVVQVGQCGNQVGMALFQELYQEASKYGPVRQRIVLNRFFRRSGAAFFSPQPKKSSPSSSSSSTKDTAHQVRLETKTHPPTSSERMQPIHASLLFPGPVATSVTPVTKHSTCAAESHGGRAQTKLRESVSAKSTAAARAKKNPGDTRKRQTRPPHSTQKLGGDTQSIRPPPRTSNNNGSLKAAHTVSASSTSAEHAGVSAQQRTKSAFEVDDVATNNVRLTARAVLVDMEPKVLRSCVANAGFYPSQRLVKSKSRRSPWRYDARRCVQRQSGSANNWAYGYSYHGPACREEVVTAVRREISLCDKCDGILVIQSLGGGTGAGLGTYLTRTFREEFPELPLWNTVVWPYTSGEVVVQYFNCLLTLATLAEISNCVFMFSNDNLFRICSNLWSINSPTVEELNVVLARSLSSVLLPSVSIDVPQQGHESRPQTGDQLSFLLRLEAACFDNRQDSGNQVSNVIRSSELHNLTKLDYSSWNDSKESQQREELKTRRFLRSLECEIKRTESLSAFLSCIVAENASNGAMFNFVNVRTVPQIAPFAEEFNSYSWSALCKRLRNMQLASANIEEGFRRHDPDSHNFALAINVIFRGTEAESGSVEEEGRKHFERSLLTNKGALPKLYGWKTHDAANSPYKTVTIVSNCQSCTPLLQACIYNSWTLLCSRAYLYQYSRWGLTVTHFDSAIRRLLIILDMYNSL